MKKITLLGFLLFISVGFKAFAQDNILGDVDTVLLSKYIQFAKLNYTQKKIFDKRAEIAKTAVPITSLSYLDIFNASYIFRPNDNTAIASPGATANPYAVNGFQFGLTLSLGAFMEKPFQIKQARLNYELAKLDAEEYNSTLEVEVKTRYYNYIAARAQVKLTAQNLLDYTLIADGISSKFQRSDPTVTIEIYDQSRVAITTAKVAKLTAEVNLMKAQDLLEQIIGKKLSEIK